MKFKGKTALITGAAVGIGRAVAHKLAENGANLILVDIDPEKLEQVKKELKQYTENVIVFKCDVSDEKTVKEVCEKSLEHFSNVDILVNNAALWRHMAPFTETSTDIWKQYFDINVFGTVYFINGLLTRMCENGFGRIINVASVAGVYGNANMAPYSATKGAVISMTKALAKEVADKGVTVNAVSPGSVSPSENGDMNHTIPSELSFTGRTGSNAENANLICFLASEDAGYINGQNIQIDGCRKKQ